MFFIDRSALSLWNGIVHAVINVIIIGYCCTRLASYAAHQILLIIKQCLMQHLCLKVSFCPSNYKNTFFLTMFNATFV
jgi:hypothetical protein